MSLGRPSLTVMILTRDEAIHIARCIESVKPVADRIYVIDSGSTDDTVAIARRCGAEVLHNDWVNHAAQVNFAIDAMPSETDWIFRIDADETLPPASASRLKDTLARMADDAAGIALRRQIIFLGRRIRWGGIEPSWQLRLWRSGQGRCEPRWMDEHMAVDGRVEKAALEIVDENLNPLDWWTAKHNRYASLEAIETLAAQGHLPPGLLRTETAAAPGGTRQARMKRWLKEQVYNRLPTGLRSLSYFLYRYILRLGFLDGQAGYYFHLLQGYWYRSLVDAKVREILARAERQGLAVEAAVAQTTGIDLIVARQRLTAQADAPRTADGQTTPAPQPERLGSTPPASRPAPSAPKTSEVYS
ncbi:MAG: glycosyltransferase family 2 protein [Pseudomonadota bacterium]